MKMRLAFYSRKSIFSVYNELGPGLLEKVYEKVLAFELKNNGLSIKNPSSYSDKI